MFSRIALCVSLSTIAVTSTLSAIISSHLLNARFVVMTVVFLSVLSDRWLNNSSRLVTRNVSELVADDHVVSFELVLECP